MMKLPDKPSELIRLALKDLAEGLKEKQFDVDMDFWVARDPGLPRCTVCLAGAVMVRELGFSTLHDATPSLVGGDTEAKLDALNYLRQGNVEDALIMLDQCEEIWPPGLETDREICPYADDPQEFFKDMRALADHLEEHKL